MPLSVFDSESWTPCPDDKLTESLANLLCFKLGGKRLDELLSHGFTLMQTAIVRRNYNTDNAFVQACSASVHQGDHAAPRFLNFRCSCFRNS